MIFLLVGLACGEPQCGSVARSWEQPECGCRDAVIHYDLAVGGKVQHADSLVRALALRGQP